MKIVFMDEDTSYFWVLDESGRIWQAWYEDGDSPAVRMETWDTWSPRAVYAQINELIIESSN